MAIYDNLSQRTSSKTSAPGGNVSNWTVDDIRKSDILVFRESATDYVDTVIAPNGLQIGLLDEAFITDLLVTGHITGSGVVYSELGFSGSLQTLTDGSNYLKGLNGISITNNVDGSVTVAGPSVGPSVRKVIPTIGGDIAAATADNLSTPICLQIPGLAFSDYNYDDGVLDVFLNGDLLSKGTETQVQAGQKDYTIMTDLGTTGRLRFRYAIGPEDELLIIARNLGGEIVGANTGPTAGAGLTGTGVFAVNVDNTTVRINNDNLEVLKTPNALANGAGIDTLSFDGSAAKSISVKPVTGSPITVSGAGVGMDIQSMTAVTLGSNDEVLVSQSGNLAKATMGDIVSLVGGIASGAPSDAAFLVVQTSAGLTNERALVAGNGLQIADGGANNNFTVSALLETSGGLEFVSGKLAVKVADFVGTGLTDNSGQIDINVSSLAGSGLGVSGSKLTLDFSQVAAATNTIAVAAGDGLNLGGTATIGAASSTINLEVKSSDIAGDGLKVTNNDLDLHLQGTNGITIATGSPDGNGYTPIIIDGSSLQTNADITGVVAGTGLTGGGLSGDVTLNVGGLTVSELHADSLTTSSESFTSNDSSLMTAAAINNLILAKGYTTNTGDITSVIAGSGLSNGGTAGDVTVNIDYHGNDSIIKTATDGTGITIDGENDLLLVHDADTNLVKYVKASQIGATGGSGGGEAGIIGSAEDGDYTDGLFTDFNTNTPTGTAIDRFNEILKSLVPKSTPSLAKIDVNTAVGVNAILSFGASNNVSGVTNVPASADLAAVNVNGSYTSSTSSAGHIRLGVYGTAIDIIGDLASNVSVNNTATGITNYAAGAFGDANLGNLILELNGSDVYTLDLTNNGTGTGSAGSGTGNHVTSGAGFINVSAVTDGRYGTGDPYALSKHRTGRYKVAANRQRQGYNYLRVRHEIGSDVRTTNHVQWVVDAVGTSGEIALSTNTLNGLNMTGSKYLSGINYHTGGTATYAVTVGNFYNRTHSLDNMVVDGTSIAPVNVTPTVIGGGENNAKTISVSETVTIDSTILLNQSMDASISITHPTKTNVSSGAASTIVGLLVYNISEASNETLKTTENFDGESYRLADHAFETQANVAANSYTSNTSLLSNTGLQVWNRRLVSPSRSTNSGNFSTFANGHTNPNYSTITSGTRSYFRKFTNNTGGSTSNFTINIDGSGTIVSNATTLSTDKIKVYAKLPGPAGNKTGWMDISQPFQTGSYNDNSGCLVEAFDSTLNSVILCTFGTKFVENGDHIVIKIVADGSWSGHVDELRITWR